MNYHLSSWNAHGSLSSRHLMDLVLVLTEKEIKVRYKSSWLGYVWSIANPLAFALVYFIAFGVFMRAPVPNYPAFLIAGLFPWQWFANSINASPSIFLHNQSLIKKVQFPRNVLVATVILNDALHFMLSIPVIALFVLLYGSRPTVSWFLGIPLLVLGQILLVYGLAAAIASLNLFFRDLERLTGILVTFLFFLTPIVYSASMIPGQYQMIIYLNPVAPLFLSWQELFLSGNLDWSIITVSYFYSLLSLGFGSWLYRKLSDKFAEVV